MNVAIYTHDMHNHNRRLMPWRVTVEVAACMERLGHKVVVLNGVRRTDRTSEDFTVDSLICVPKPDNRKDVDAIAQACRDNRIHVLFYPLGWRSPVERICSLEKRGDVAIVWYVPSAWYHLVHVVKSLPHLGVRATLPYLYQASMPRRHFVRKLRKTGDRPVITMTDHNKRMLSIYGYPDECITCVPPGKSPLSLRGAAGPTFEYIKSQVRDRPYFLFFGPPQAIRGTRVLLKAFSRACGKHDDVCLVCLFRSDAGIQTEVLRREFERSQYYGERLFCVWESVAGAELDAFIRQCHAVIEPFLLVPSEIPLAVIEAAGYGKPVICSDPDGTGHYAKAFGLAVPPGNSGLLETAMLCLLDGTDLYAAKCRAALQTYAQHPTWREVAEAWLAVADRAINQNPSRRSRKLLVQ